ncbi:MAG: outer membrane protein transport protein [Verrucomicrobia bacterium]|nr:outer membrane protein transport protein [Verrucomicrobiota bacterium]
MVKPVTINGRAARAILVCAGLATFAFPGNSRAGSFLLNEQSVSGLGSAYAGGAAQAEDASTIFFNPAGMALLDRGELQAGGQYLIPTAYFHNDGSRLRAPGTPFNGEPLTGIDSGDSGKDKLLPNFYLSQPVFRSRNYGDLSVGFGLSVPFGLETDYDPTWVGRYVALRSKLTTLDLQPSIAYRFLDRISIGANLDVQYASARLSQAVDFGAIGAGVLNQTFFPLLPPAVRGAVAGAYARAGFVPQGRDGVSELSASSWDLGFTVGGIIEYLKGDENSFFQDGRIGISYRSGITHDLHGSAQFRGVPALTAPGSPVQFPAAAALQGTFFNQAVSARLDLPDVYHFSVYQRFLHQFALLGDIAWTRWSRLQQVPIMYSNPLTEAAAGQASSLNIDYKDSLRYAIGFEWYASKCLTLRLGFAYDETPIRNAETRNPRIPDDNRYFVSGGLQYRPASWVAFDVGYAHLFVGNAAVDVTDAQGHNVRGSFDASVDIVSASVTFLWGGPKTAEAPSTEGKGTGKGYLK